jgi:hypothetical protein
MSSSSISSTSKPIPPAPVKATKPQEKIDPEVAARNSVRAWDEADGAKSAYVRVTVNRLQHQITRGQTEFLIDSPDTPEQVNYLKNLQLPEGFTYRFLDKVGHTPVPSRSGGPHSLHPYSGDRAFSPQGGLARVPLLQLAPDQVDDVKGLMLKFFKDVKANSSGSHRNPVMVEQLVAHASSQSDPESFLFEMATQLADHAKYYGDNVPLKVLLKHLPPVQWREMFEFDLEKKDEWPDPRAMRGAVTRSLADVQQPAAQPQAGVNLAAAGNAYILTVVREPDNPVAAAEVLVRKIRQADSSNEGQAQAIQRMFDQLNDACARSRTPTLEPMYAFVSVLGAPYEEIYRQRLPAKPQEPAAKYIDKLVASESAVMQGEFARFAQAREGILTMIAKVGKKDKSAAAELQSRLDFAVTGVAKGWIRDLCSRESPLHQNDFAKFQLAYVRVTGLIGRLDEASQNSLVGELNQTLESAALTFPAHEQALRDLKL